MKRAKLRLLARPYPALVSGTPRSFSFEPASGRFTLRYSTRRAGGRIRFKPGSVTEVMVPRVQYPRGYRVSVSGARVVSRAGARVLRIAACSDARNVSVRVTRGPAPPASRRCG